MLLIKVFVLDYLFGYIPSIFFGRNLFYLIKKHNII